jgi:hypothetical protein
METRNQLILWLEQVACVSKQWNQTKPPLVYFVLLGARINFSVDISAVMWPLMRSEVWPNAMTLCWDMCVNAARYFESLLNVPQTYC